MTHIHFWTLKRLPGIEHWDPDVEPESYPSGYGHSFLEPYARLGRSVSVSIGRWPPRRTTCLVASFEELTEWRPEVLPFVGLQLALTALRHRAVAVVRNDLPLDIPVPPFTGLELMPSPQSITNPIRQVPVPPFPQRGLLPRRQERGTTIRVVALKAIRSNVPEWLVDGEIPIALGNLGVDLRVDTETEDSAPWHDFRDVDVALCVRRYHPKFDTDSAYVRKPATKLINAWHAGAIPIVMPEAAYLRLVRDGVDAIVVETPADVVRAVGRLAVDPDLVARMQAAGRERADALGVAEATDAWVAALQSVPPAVIPEVLRYCVSMGYGCLRGGGRVLNRLLKRLWPSWRARAADVHRG